MACVYRIYERVLYRYEYCYILPPLLVVSMHASASRSRIRTTRTLHSLGLEYIVRLVRIVVLGCTKENNVHKLNVVFGFIATQERTQHVTTQTLNPEHRKTPNQVDGYVCCRPACAVCC